MSAWFEVSKDGLSRLVSRRGSHWILGELLQNAWDAPGVTMVNVTVTAAGNGMTQVIVEDDSPVGFVDLTHAFTLFADSGKKNDPSLRGRFNLGEKLVLSLCREAEIATTQGTVLFGPDGRRSLKAKRARGTSFRGTMRLNRVDAEAALAEVRYFIPPPTIKTFVNGVELVRREPLRTFSCSLPTEIADKEGVMRRTKRKSEVTLYVPPDGRPGTVYEMGIPVCETGDQFDVDVGQKVPLSFERDALLPSFLRDLRVAVINSAADLVDDHAVASDWIGQAIASPNVEPEAVERILRKRFGEKIVSFDPNDREANDRAVAAGYVVLHGGTFTKEQWHNVRATNFVQPAGKVTPTPKPFDPEGKPAKVVERTKGMRVFADFVQRLAREVMGVEIGVQFLQSFNASAAYGSRQMTFNVGRLGVSWFEGPLREEQIDLVIHELAHEYSDNHLSKDYNDALTRIGAKAVMLALRDAEFFDLQQDCESLE